MSKLIIRNFPAADEAAISPDQTFTADTALTFYPTLTNQQYVLFPGLQRTVTLTSDEDLSTVDFVVNGFDNYGNAINETIAGPNATTEEGTVEFHKITSIVPSISSPVPGDSVSVGTGTKGTFSWIPLDRNRKFFQACIQAVVTGTVQYDINKTLTDPEIFINSNNVIQTPTSFAVDASLTNANSNQYFYLVSPATALQIVVDTASTGSLTVTILQQGE